MGGRREFITLLSGAVAWPLAAQGQQPMGLRIGLLRTTTAAPFTYVLEALREGLGEEGFVQGHNVSIDQRWADNRLDQLPMLAGELVNLPVAAIVGVAAGPRQAEVLPMRQREFITLLGGADAARPLAACPSQPSL